MSPPAFFPTPVVQQAFDAAANLVSDAADHVEAFSGWVVEDDPVFVAFARVVGAAVAAAHRDDDVGGLHRVRG